MNNYAGAVVDWPALWLWLAMWLVLTVTVMSVIVSRIDDLGAKRSCLRIDPRAVQDPFSDG